VENVEKQTIRIGSVTLSLDEAEETLAAIRSGKVDAVVVEGREDHEIYTFRDPSHPFRLLVEAMNEGALLTTIDGIVSYQNPMFSQMVGLDPSSMKSRPLAELVPPEQRGALAQLLERAQSGPVRGNIELIGSGERSVLVQLSVSRALLVDVEVFCVVVTDLTEQRRQEALYRAARLEVEDRDRLFSVAAHELRNPLGVIELQAQLLGRLLDMSREAAALPIDRALTMVSKLRQQGRRLAQLVTNLLDIGSIGAGRLDLAREEFDLADAVRAALELSREELERSGSSIAFELQPARGCWDRVRIEQVIENLVSNAAKYGRGRPVRVTVERNDALARLCVEDQGRGIPVEAHERIFRPYERVAGDEGISGLGMGLYVTAELVKAHGGTIRVRDRPGGGSVFVVELPLGYADEGGGAAAETPERNKGA
jgi:PAS domain S-box-containing protein